MFAVYRKCTHGTVYVVTCGSWAKCSKAARRLRVEYGLNVWVTRT